MPRLKLKSLINFLPFIFVFLSGGVQAQVDIKLNCTLTVIHTFSSGNREQESIKVILDVFQNNKHLAILSSSNDMASVTTIKRPSIESIVDVSDDNKWNLTNTTVGDKTATSQIIIDRNTGQIFYYRDFNNSSISTKGDGTCFKIDKSKKKF
jgi:hypothetical protein